MLFLLLMYILVEVTKSQDGHRTADEMEEYCDENPWDAECEDFVNPETVSPSSSTPEKNDTSTQVDDEQ